VQSIRQLAAAFAVGAIEALVFDASLRNALAAAQSPGVSSLTPWWVVGQVAERSVWVVAAVVLWLCAPLMTRIATRLSPMGNHVTSSAALEAVGRLMMAMPLIWLAATLLILALRITFAGNWELDGGMFLAASFYNNLLLEYLPWAAGGIVLIALSRHATD
jgi:hypothetical protein